MTTQADTSATALAQAYEDFERARSKLVELRRQMPHATVANYTLQDAGGAVALADLFGAHTDLIVIHNMGARCAYCTMWADGFNGVLPHLENRAAFVVLSPDAPVAQQQFAAQRGWRFRMASSQGTSFRADLGFQHGDELTPGVSIFHRAADGTITHVSRDIFGPGDLYCSAWHLFDLLPGGSGDWEPKFTY